MYNVPCTEQSRIVCLKFDILSDQLVWQVDVKHWAGWTAYTIFIFGTFLTLKIINYRLHRALGIDPVVEEEEEHGSEDEEKVSETGKAATSEDAKKEEEAEVERKELGLDGQVVDTAQTKDLEAGFTLPGQTLEIEKAAELKGNETEESLQHHRDSASTLGYSSNHQSTPEETTELRALAVGGEEGEETAKPLLVAVDLEGEGEEGDEGKEEEGGRKDDEGLDQADSSGSTLRAAKESSSSEGEYHTPPVVSFTPSSSTEPGLKPIHEEPLSSQPTNEK